MNCPRCNALWKEAQAIYCCYYGGEIVCRKLGIPFYAGFSENAPDARIRKLDENTLHAARYYAKDNPSGGVDG